MICIYLISNVVNGKTYIGSTVNCRKRFMAHRNALNHGYHQNLYLQRAWNKYGENCFYFIIIEKIEKQALLNNKEIKYIERLGTNEYKYGYNLKAPFNSHLSSKEHKNNISKAKKGCKGHPISEKSKQIISKTHKGNKYGLGHEHSLEARQRMSEIMKGNKHCLGRKLTKETRQKMSEALKGNTRGHGGKGKKLNEKTKRKISEARKGTRLTEETKRKISKSTKGKYMGSERWNAKTVKCIETNKIYDTIIEAIRETGITGISHVARGDYKTAGGFHWEYINKEVQS